MSPDVKSAFFESYTFPNDYKTSSSQQLIMSLLETNKFANTFKYQIINHNDPLHYIYN